MALQSSAVYQVKNGLRVDLMRYLGERIVPQRRNKFGEVIYNRRVRHLFRNLRTNRVIELKSLNRVQQIGIN